MCSTSVYFVSRNGCCKPRMTRIWYRGPDHSGKRVWTTQLGKPPVRPCDRYNSRVDSEEADGECLWRSP
jgi:hypothetical protein